MEITVVSADANKLRKYLDDQMIDYSVGAMPGKAHEIFKVDTDTADEDVLKKDLQKMKIRHTLLREQFATAETENSTQAIAQTKRLVLKLIKEDNGDKIATVGDLISALQQHNKDISVEFVANVESGRSISIARNANFDIESEGGKLLVTVGR